MLKVVLLLPKKLLLLLQWTTTIANSRWGNALSHPRLHECSFPFPSSLRPAFSTKAKWPWRPRSGGGGLGDWVLPTPSCCCLCFVLSRHLTAALHYQLQREMHFLGAQNWAFREMNSLLSRSLFPCKRWALIVRKAKNIRDSITQLGFLCLQDGNLMQWPICISGSFTQNSTLYNSFSIPKKSTLFESNKVRPTKQPKYAKPNRSYRHQR